MSPSGELRFAEDPPEGPFIVLLGDALGKFVTRDDDGRIVGLTVRINGEEFVIALVRVEAGTATKETQP